MDANKRITLREERLLRWEHYLLRTRAGAGYLAFLMLLLMVADSMTGSLYIDERQVLFGGLLLWMWAYIAHLKIRHIETIKRNRGRLGTLNNQ